MTLTVEFQGQSEIALYQEWGGWLTWNEKDVSRPFMTMILISVIMVGWADVLDSDRVTSDDGVPSTYLVLKLFHGMILLSIHWPFWLKNNYLAWSASVYVIVVFYIPSLTYYYYFYLFFANCRKSAKTFVNTTHVLPWRTRCVSPRPPRSRLSVARSCWMPSVNGRRKWTMNTRRRKSWGWSWGEVRMGRGWGLELRRGERMGRVGGDWSWGGRGRVGGDWS